MHSARKARVAVVAGLLLAILAPPAVSAPTEQRRFEAFDADGDPAVPVRKRQGADTCTSSFVNSQSTALRCFAGSSIRDPCFIDPNDPDRAVCTPAPWARSSVGLSGIEDAVEDDRRTPVRRGPWAIELRSGAECSFLSGATAARGNRRLNYACDDDRFLWGIPRRSRPVWTILRSRTATGRPWRRAKIAVAWR